MADTEDTQDEFEVRLAFVHVTYGLGKYVEQTLDRHQEDGILLLQALTPCLGGSMQPLSKLLADLSR